LYVPLGTVIEFQPSERHPSMSGAHGWQALSTHSPSETIAVRHGAPSGWLSHAPTSSGFAQYVGGAAQASA
jgi:hypothetical protein